MQGHDALERLAHEDVAVADEIHALFQRAYKKEAELIGAGVFPPLLRTADNIRMADTQFFGCWGERGLVSVAEVEERAGELTLCSLLVDPELFRRGLASRLLAFILASFSWHRIVVETAAANRPAIALYQGFGFVEIDRWEAPYEIAKVRLELTSG